MQLDCSDMGVGPACAIFSFGLTPWIWREKVGADPNAITVHVLAT